MLNISSLSKPIMSAKERKQYSIFDAVRLSDNRTGETSLEREVSNTIAGMVGESPRGLYIPPEIIFGARALSEISKPINLRLLDAVNDPSGGYTVGEETTPLIAYLFPASVALRLGSTLIPSMFADSSGRASFTGDVSVPVETISDEAEWIAPGGTATDGAHNSKFGSAMAKPHRLYAERETSSQLLSQTPQSNALFASLLMRPVGASIDRAVFAGNGAAQPLGLLRSSLVTNVSHGTDGGAPSRAKLAEAEGNVISANAPMTTAGYVLSANARKTLKSTPVVAGASSYLLETINGRDYVNGFPAIASKFLPDDGAKGSGTNLGSYLVGEWQFALVALWGVMDILVDRYTKKREGKVIFSVNSYADTLHPLPTCFSRATDIVNS